MIGIDPDLDFRYDPQQAKHYGFCRICGREIYTKGLEVHADCEKYEESEDE